MNVYATPVPMLEGVGLFVRFDYEGEVWTEEDMMVAAQDIEELLSPVRAYLKARAKGDLPQRKPKPCQGCGGQGS